MLINFIKALIVGVAVSIPLGPVGVLCIQKTISKSQLNGFSLGMGAALADLIFAGISLFSLAIVSEFLAANRAWVLLVGGVVIIIVGLSLLLKNPLKLLREKKVKQTGKLTDGVQGFVITFTNPGALVLMLSAFAFAGIKPESFDVPLSMFILLSGVFLGEALWWFSLSALVNIFRSKFSLRGLLVLNRITGAIIAACGFVSLFEGLYELIFL
ncbi:MAG: LysE family transporter [Bacteroidales bacterium]|nr:LysE family transporter [Bacteroidales bacterium]